MVECDKDLNLLSSPSFAMCLDRFLAFLHISCSSQDVLWVDDSAVCTTSVVAVGDSAVGTPSFYTNIWSKVDLVVNVLLLSLLNKFPFAASKYDFDFFAST